MLRQTTRLKSLASLCQRNDVPITASLDALGLFDLRAVTVSVASFFSTQPAPGFNLSASARSLEFERVPPPPDSSSAGLLKRAMLKLGGFYSKESTLMRASGALYGAVKETAADPALFKVMEVPDDFQHQHSMLTLHVWLVLARLRQEAGDAKDLAQLVYDDFQEDVEQRARAAGAKSGLRNQLGELEKQFYGSCMAYDKALQGEDPAAESLADALLRNVYQAEDGKAAAAATLERYLRRELACLALTDSAAVMQGNIKFSFAAAGQK